MLDTVINRTSIVRLPLRLIFQNIVINDTIYYYCCTNGILIVIITIVNITEHESADVCMTDVTAGVQ